MLLRAPAAPAALTLLRSTAVADQLTLAARHMTANTADASTSSSPQPDSKGKQPPSSATNITASATAAAAASTDPSSSSSRPQAPPPESAPPSHHVTKRGWSLFGTAPRFQNPWQTGAMDKPLSDVMKFGREMRSLKVGPWGFLKGITHPTPEDFRRAFPHHPLTPTSTAPAAPGGVAAVWLGHASVLVNMEGLTFITDPVFSERCSPVQFLGPRRVVPNLFHPEDPAAPHLDGVLISHNHYDHLDTASVKRLHKRYGPGLRWYVPLGLAGWFRATGITNVVELDWWQAATHPGTQVELVLTPAQHWSSRSGMDRRATLWGGWAVKGPRTSFWFAGDTGYCPVFKDIGARLGPFDLAAIPIGAYEPRWFMAPQHIGPEAAVQVAQDVRARHSFAIHCCTFFLTTEPLDEPPSLLRTAVAAAGLAPDAFITLQHGARMEVEGGRLLNQPLQLPVQKPS